MRPAWRAGLLSARSALSRHRHLLALAIFVLVIGTVYQSVLLGDRSLVTNGPLAPGHLFVGDPSAGGPITAPFERLESVAWSHGHLPIVDPYQGYGIPLIADQGVPVYPPQVLAHLIFPHNYSIWIVVNLIALAFGCYLLASAFGQSFFAAMAVGTAAAFAGVAPPNLNMGMLNPLAVLPFVLVSIRFAVDPASRHRRSALLGAVTSVALLCLSGFQEVLPLMAAVIVLYTAGMIIHFRTWSVRPGLIVATALSGFGGVVVGIVGLLPPLDILRSHSSLNAPGSYVLHEPLNWLSTLFVPGIAGQGLAAEPQQLGHTVWTLGTPILFPVLVLAVLVAVRHGGRHVRFYVWPSVALVVYGILGYANVLNVLKLFDVPLLNSIVTIRLLQFGWWIPWCLLLGAVISNVRLLNKLDALAVLVATGLLDLYFVAKFGDALKAQKLGQYLLLAHHAAIKAAIVVVVFLVLVAAARSLRWPLAVPSALAVLVLTTSLYYLPTNFFPASGDTVTSTLRVPGVDPRSGNHLVYFGGAFPMPTTTYSNQVWGPIIPWPLQALALTTFTNAQTGGFSPIFDGVPTFALANNDARLVSLLRSLGTDTLVMSSPLPSSSFGVIATCGKPTPPGAMPELCLLGKASFVGGPSAPPGIAYAVLGATPLVDADARLVAVSTTGVGLDRLLAHLSPTATSLPPEAYVTTTEHRLTAARDVVGIERTADTQSVTLALRSGTAGIAVLRESYMDGMHATVNGRSVPVMAVDGGLWTAVPIDGGRSHVVLDYVSHGEIAEFGVGAVGLVALGVAWIALGVIRLRRRLRATASRPASGMPAAPTDAAPTPVPPGDDTEMVSPHQL
jgi:hypothetical protein